MWPIQLAFRLLISCRIFVCSLTLSNTSSFLTWSVQTIFFILLQYNISKLSRCFWSTARSVQFQYVIKLGSKCSLSLVSPSVYVQCASKERTLLLLNAAFSMALLNFISQVHLPSFGNKLPKYLKDSPFSSLFLWHYPMVLNLVNWN